MITLDVSNSVLDSLDCRGTGLVSFNLDGCITLKSLNCAYTGSGFSLDLSHCTSLEKLYTGGIKDLDVSNLPLLKTLHYRNSFSVLDLTNNPKLEDLRIFVPMYGEMGKIDLSNNYQLSYFSIDFSSYVQSDPDMYLDLSNRKVLKSLSFSWAGGRGGGVAENSIKKLNLSGCTSLESIYIEREPGISGHICSLDASGCITLSELNLYDMELKELNLEGCSTLSILDCSRNRLQPSLDVSNCRELSSIDCTNNSDLAELILYRNHSIQSLLKDSHTQIVWAD